MAKGRFCNCAIYVMCLENNDSLGAGLRTYMMDEENQQKNVIL